MTDTLCKRCGRRNAGRYTRTAVGMDLTQVHEVIWLCVGCMSDASVENMKALWRTTQGWTENNDLRDMFW